MVCDEILAYEPERDVRLLHMNSRQFWTPAWDLHRIKPVKNAAYYKGTWSLQNTKKIGLEKKVPKPHSNQNIKHTEQSKNMKSCKRIKPNNI